MTGSRVGPETIELEVEITSSDTGSEVGDLDQEMPEEEDLVA
jgi:hypothetical protein